ncbi:MAG: hypothetical protein ACXAEU_25880 [Candidatus Hodarchaeales archaeon]|jgi:hypothetical protein
MQQELINKDFFDFNVDITPIKSYFARGKQERIDRINSAIDEELDWLKRNSDPKAVLTFLSPPNEDPLWDRADEIAAAVVSIGEKPESRVKELFDNGQMEIGLILDTLASALVDSCARQVYHKIVNVAKNKQIPLTGRITPGGGNGEADFSYQKKLFDFVDLEAIDVSVSSGMMMIPVKSSSFFTLMGTDVETSLGCGHCRNCPRLKKCEYKKFGIFSH